MRAGTYRGQVTYSVGPHKDFDLGNVMLPNDEQITLNFILSVDHILKVEIPPGGERVELLPQGGWQGWLSQAQTDAAVQGPDLQLLFHRALQDRHGMPVRRGRQTTPAGSVTPGRGARCRCRSA